MPRFRRKGSSGDCVSAESVNGYTGGGGRFLRTPRDAEAIDPRGKDLKTDTPLTQTTFKAIIPAAAERGKKSQAAGGPFKAGEEVRLRSLAQTRNELLDELDKHSRNRPAQPLNSRKIEHFKAEAAFVRFQESLGTIEATEESIKAVFSTFGDSAKVLSKTTTGPATLTWLGSEFAENLLAGLYPKGDAKISQNTDRETELSAAFATQAKQLLSDGKLNQRGFNALMAGFAAGMRGRTGNAHPAAAPQAGEKPRQKRMELGAANRSEAVQTALQAAFNSLPDDKKQEVSDNGIHPDLELARSEPTLPDLIEKLEISHLNAGGLDHKHGGKGKEEALETSKTPGPLPTPSSKPKSPPSARDLKQDHLADSIPNVSRRPLPRSLSVPTPKARTLPVNALDAQINKLTQTFNALQGKVGQASESTAASFKDLQRASEALTTRLDQIARDAKASQADLGIQAQIGQLSASIEKLSEAIHTRTAPPIGAKPIASDQAPQLTASDPIPIQDQLVALTRLSEEFLERLDRSVQTQPESARIERKAEHSILGRSDSDVDDGDPQPAAIRNADSDAARESDLLDLELNEQMPQAMNLTSISPSPAGDTTFVNAPVVNGSKQETQSTPTDANESESAVPTSLETQASDRPNPGADNKHTTDQPGSITNSTSVPYVPGTPASATSDARSPDTATTTPETNPAPSGIAEPIQPNNTPAEPQAVEQMNLGRPVPAPTDERTVPAAAKTSAGFAAANRSSDSRNGGEEISETSSNQPTTPPEPITGSAANGSDRPTGLAGPAQGPHSKQPGDSPENDPGIDTGGDPATLSTTDTKSSIPAAHTRRPMVTETDEPIAPPVVPMSRISAKGRLFSLREQLTQAKERLDQMSHEWQPELASAFTTADIQTNIKTINRLIRELEKLEGHISASKNQTDPLSPAEDDYIEPSKRQAINSLATATMSLLKDTGKKHEQLLSILHAIDRFETKSNPTSDSVKRSSTLGSKKTKNEELYGDPAGWKVPESSKKNKNNPGLPSALNDKPQESAQRPGQAVRHAQFEYPTQKIDAVTNYFLAEIDNAYKTAKKDIRSGKTTNERATKSISKLEESYKEAIFDIYNAANSEASSIQQKIEHDITAASKNPDNPISEKASGNDTIRRSSAAFRLSVEAAESQLTADLDRFTQLAAAKEGGLKATQPRTDSAFAQTRSPAHQFALGLPTPEQLEAGQYPDAGKAMAAMKNSFAALCSEIAAGEGWAGQEADIPEVTRVTQNFKAIERVINAYEEIHQSNERLDSERALEFRNVFSKDMVRNIEPTIDDATLLSLIQHEYPSAILQGESHLANKIEILLDIRKSNKRELNGEIEKSHQLAQTAITKLQREHTPQTPQPLSDSKATKPTEPDATGVGAIEPKYEEARSQFEAGLTTLLETGADGELNLLLKGFLQLSPTAEYGEDFVSALEKTFENVALNSIREDTFPRLTGAFSKAFSAEINSFKGENTSPPERLSEIADSFLGLIDQARQDISSLWGPKEMLSGEAEIRESLRQLAPDNGETVEEEEEGEADEVDAADTTSQTSSGSLSPAQPLSSAPSTPASPDQGSADQATWVSWLTSMAQASSVRAGATPDRPPVKSPRMDWGQLGQKLVSLPVPPERSATEALTTTLTALIKAMPDESDEARLVDVMQGMLDACTTKEQMESVASATLDAADNLGEDAITGQMVVETLFTKLSQALIDMRADENGSYQEGFAGVRSAIHHIISTKDGTASTAARFAASVFSVADPKFRPGDAIDIETDAAGIPLNPDAPMEPPLPPLPERQSLDTPAVSSSTGPTSRTLDSKATVTPPETRGAAQIQDPVLASPVAQASAPPTKSSLPATDSKGSAPVSVQRSQPEPLPSRQPKANALKQVYQSLKEGGKSNEVINGVARAIASSEPPLSDVEFLHVWAALGERVKELNGDLAKLSSAFASAILRSPQPGTDDAAAIRCRTAARFALSLFGVNGKTGKPALAVVAEQFLRFVKPAAGSVNTDFQLKQQLQELGYYASRSGPVAERIRRALAKFPGPLGTPVKNPAVRAFDLGALAPRTATTEQGAIRFLTDRLAGSSSAPSTPSKSRPPERKSGK